MPKEQHVEQDNVALYSIGGWFNDLLPLGDDLQKHPLLVGFGGYFKLSTIDASFRGQLIDFHGKSSIAGRLSDNEVHFSKLYDSPGVNDEYPINYRLVKQGNLWVGEYQMPNNERGQTACQINLFPGSGVNIAMPHFRDNLTDL